MDWLLHQPLTGSGFLVYAEGLDLRMHEDVDDGGEPVLPVMTGDNGNALDLALMILDDYARRVRPTNASDWKFRLIS